MHKFSRERILAHLHIRGQHPITAGRHGQPVIKGVRPSRRRIRLAANSIVRPIRLHAGLHEPHDHGRLGPDALLALVVLLDPDRGPDLFHARRDAVKEGKDVEPPPHLGRVPRWEVVELAELDAGHQAGHHLHEEVECPA